MSPRALRRVVSLLLSALLAGSARAEERLHVVVLHTNDVHGQVLTRKATWLDKQNPPEIGGLARSTRFAQTAGTFVARRIRTRFATPWSNSWLPTHIAS